MGMGDPDDGSKRTITLSFGGVDQAWEVKAIRQILEKRDDLGHVTQQSYSSGSVTFSVESTIPARKLSEALLLNPPSGLKLQVLEVNRGNINLRAVVER